jgi:D-alanine-D-alanine ligase
VLATILYNAPSLPTDHRDYAQEAGVLEAVEAVEAALGRIGHSSHRLAAPSDPRSLALELARNKADVVVNFFEGLHGTGAGESPLAGLLELLGVPFTGTGSEGLALVRDKARTKWLLSGAGLPTPAFVFVPAHEPIETSRFEALLAAGPVIVKPAHEDASLGIAQSSVVTNHAALARQLDEVRRRYGAAMIEQFIAGREFNLGILALPEAELLPLAEVEFPSDGRVPWNIVTYDAKWIPTSVEFDAGTPVRCPAATAPALAAELSRVSLAAFRLTGCRDYARVDLRVDAAGKVYILEVNANPDISPSAGLANAIRVAGLGYDEFVGRLVETARARGRTD